MNSLIKPKKEKYQPGVPCGHPGCAAHLSHPCEFCGRYAAGTKAGPDEDALWHSIVYDLTHHDPIVAQVAQAGRQMGWSRLQMLGVMVRHLAEMNEKLAEMTKTAFFDNPA